jgi:hypothetical protein
MYIYNYIPVYICVCICVCAHECVCVHLLVFLALFFSIEQAGLGAVKCLLIEDKVAAVRVQVRCHPSARLQPR